MAIVIPSDLRFLIGFRFAELIPFEANTVSLATILPPLFRLAVLEGSDSQRAKEDSGDIHRSVEALLENNRLKGFDSPQGRRLLERIVQTSLVRTVKQQKTGSLQIDGLVPYSLASFKVAFPTNQAGFRQVDRLLYDMLLTQWDGDKKKVSKFIEHVFGEGVMIKGAPEPTATRLPGEHPELDVMTELSLAFLDGFKGVTPKRSSRSYVAAKPLPQFQAGFGKDLYRFLWSYSRRMPKQLLIDQTITLIAFELTVMTAKLFHTIPPWTTPAGRAETKDTTDEESLPLELYVDWTGDPRHLSRSMAVNCLRRDIASIGPFIRAVLELRYLHVVVTGLKSDKAFRTRIVEFLGEQPNQDTHQFIERLLDLTAHPDIEPEMRREARGHLRAIRDANSSKQGSEDDDADPNRPETEADALINEMDRRNLGPVEQVQELLFAVQNGKIQSNILQWIRDVGGVGTAHGFISGGVNRKTWAYAPSNDVLTMLVQLCAVDYQRWNPLKNDRPERFGLGDFLEWLDRRFGIIVDRPPRDLGFDGPEHIAAARENLQALLARLRQMGMFEIQSDDFSVQQITPPFVDSEVTSHGQHADWMMR